VRRDVGQGPALDPRTGQPLEPVVDVDADVLDDSGAVDDD